MRIILFSSQTYDRDSFLAEPLPAAWSCSSNRHA